MTLYCAKCGCIVGKEIAGKLKIGTVYYCAECDPRNIKMDLPPGFAEIFGGLKR